MTLAEAYERTLEEEALLQELEDQKGCPTCHRRVLDDYIVCPSCTTQLKEPCPTCGKPLSYSWVACPYCATLRRQRGRLEPGEEATTVLPRASTTEASRSSNGTPRTERAPTPERDDGLSASPSSP
jgi:hypothetical protein